MIYSWSLQISFLRITSKSWTKPSGLDTISYHFISAFASADTVRIIASQLKLNRCVTLFSPHHLVRCKNYFSILFPLSDKEVIDPDIPLNLSKSNEIWSPARTLESASDFNHSTSCLTPNLPIFMTDTYKRNEQETSEDLNKIFPVSWCDWNDCANICCCNWC